MIKERLKNIALGNIKPLKNFKQESAVSFQDENSCPWCQVLKRCQEKQVLKSVLWFRNWTVTLLKTVDGRGEGVENRRMH